MLIACGVALAQTNAAKRNAREAADVAGESKTADAKAAKTNEDGARFYYEFTQPEFYIRHVVIEHDAAGRGAIKFERKDAGEASLTEPLEISANALARIKALWNALNFLDSKEDYQSEKQFPHLGAMRLRETLGSRERTAQFNWTNNKNAAALVEEYRRLQEQSLFVFDINVARENEPLTTPKMMSRLEELVKNGSLSDPKQLLPLLRDLQTDERIPLLARNSAARVIKRIEK